MMNSLAMLVWVVARLKEPSSYAGLAGLLTAAHLCTNCNDHSQALTSFGVGLASFLAIVLKEKSHG